MAEAPKVLSLEEILHGLSDLARNGDGAQQTQAYRMLLAQKGGSAATLGDLLNDEDIVERLSRLMKPAGRELCKVAYHRAFGKARDEISAQPNLTAELLHPDLIKQVEGIGGLRDLYRFRPEIKRPGVPKGYPVNKGKVVQKRWCQNQAIKILLDEEAARMQELEDRDDNAETEEAGTPSQTP